MGICESCCPPTQSEVEYTEIPQQDADNGAAPVAEIPLSSAHRDGAGADNGKAAHTDGAKAISYQQQAEIPVSSEASEADEVTSTLHTSAEASAFSPAAKALSPQTPEAPTANANQQQQQLIPQQPSPSGGGSNENRSGASNERTTGAPAPAPAPALAPAVTKQSSEPPALSPVPPAHTPVPAPHTPVPAPASAPTAAHNPTPVTAMHSPKVDIPAPAAAPASAPAPAESPVPAAASTPGAGSVQESDFDPTSSVFEGLEILQKFTNKSSYDSRFIWVSLPSRSIHMSQYMTKERRHKEASLTEVTGIEACLPAKLKRVGSDSSAPLDEGLFMTINFTKGGGIDLQFPDRAVRDDWLHTLRRIMELSSKTAVGSVEAAPIA